MPCNIASSVLSNWFLSVTAEERLNTSLVKLLFFPLIADAQLKWCNLLFESNLSTPSFSYSNQHIACPDIKKN